MRGLHPGWAHPVLPQGKNPEECGCRSLLRYSAPSTEHQSLMTLESAPPPPRDRNLDGWECEPAIGISLGSRTKDPDGGPRLKPVTSSSKSGNESVSVQFPKDSSGGDPSRRLAGERKVVNASPSVSSPDACRANRIGNRDGKKIASWR
jgi:hypothetical protein